jgi:hypothetical protein
MITMGIFMSLVLMFPGISLELWRIPMKRWEMYKAKILNRRSKRSEEKLRRYYEIDLTK